MISWSNTKFSELTLRRIVWLTVRRITNLVWVLKGKNISFLLPLRKPTECWAVVEAISWLACENILHDHDHDMHHMLY